MSQSNVITRKELELTIVETEAMITNMVTRKYTEGYEKNLSDVIERIISIVEEKHNPKAYTHQDIKYISEMLRDGYFIPGGSILSGLSKQKKKKASLSNCYVLKIKNDSLESIFALLGEMARTYSYRGGCGTDLTVLRPNGVAVNNAADTSTGAISFMPMIANVTDTIGQLGRRGAMMLTIDVRHPDIMRFVWSKADPERVFYRDFMNQPLTAKKIMNTLNYSDTSTLSDDLQTKLVNICNEGKVATIDSANISIKYNNAFMQAVMDDLPWECWFPDIEHDKEKYDAEWDGDYDKWTRNGGKLIKYQTYNATVTRDNYKRFIGHQVVTGYSLDVDNAIPEGMKVHSLDHAASETFSKAKFETELCTEETLLAHIGNGPIDLTFKIPSARQLFHDACLAAWLRGDPGALFWDKVEEWTTISPTIHALLKFISTNPCSEIPSYAGGSCLLGAHVLSKYILNPWSPDARWDYILWQRYTRAATQLMNIFSDINEKMHPLEEQTRLEVFAKRIGIEFTAMGDALSMLGLPYRDTTKTINFLEWIMSTKAFIEIGTSVEIASKIGCCQVFDEIEARQKFIDLPYIQNVFDGQFTWNSNSAQHTTSELKKMILKHGVRNIGFNTVGPTGSLSILMDNCSSGIEPIFALVYNRTTRVGEKQNYKVCHTPLARVLLKTNEDSWDLDQMKKDYHITEAHELGYKDRIAIQAVIQKYCDSSISSTINLHHDCTVDDIVEIYKHAWEKGLKGITVYRDGSLAGVLNIEKPKTTSVEFGSGDAVRQQSVPRGTLLTPRLEQTSRSHRITWNGYHMYITITLDDDNRPLELFVSNLPRDVSVKNDVFDPIDYQEKMSLWMAITRLVSIGLRGGIPVQQFIKQLNKTSFVVNDLMSVICRVLNQYAIDPVLQNQILEMTAEELEHTDFTTICPKCGQKTLINQGGCSQCMSPSCTYDKCQ